jgi:hypothetical protein
MDPNVRRYNFNPKSSGWNLLTDIKPKENTLIRLKLLEPYSMENGHVFYRMYLGQNIWYSIKLHLVTGLSFDESAYVWDYVRIQLKINI